MATAEDKWDATMKTQVIVTTFFLMITLCASNARPCAFCPPYFRNTLLQELDAVPAAVLAELARPTKTDADGQSTTGYRVVAVLRGAERFRVGDMVDLPQAIPSPVGSVHLLLAEPQNAAKWQKPASAV